MTQLIHTWPALKFKQFTVRPIQVKDSSFVVYQRVLLFLIRLNGVSAHILSALKIPTFLVHNPYCETCSIRGHNRASSRLSRWEHTNNGTEVFLCSCGRR